jgi:molecular chaperone GrpE
MSTGDEKAAAPGAAPGSQEKSAEPAAEAAAVTRFDSQPTRDPEARIAVLEEENAALKDQVLRRAADLENYRKRVAREREDTANYSNQTLLLDLVPVIDDFERAITSAESSKDFDALHDGVLLIERQMTAMLEKKWGLTRFASVGEPFDPHRHQAIAMEEKDDLESPTVIEEYQKGYLLRDRVLRPAAVKVAQPGTRRTQDSAANDKET